MKIRAGHGGAATISAIPASWVMEKGGLWFDMSLSKKGDLQLKSKLCVVVQACGLSYMSVEIAGHGWRLTRQN
jgi:hypothetical protein